MDNIEQIKEELESKFLNSEKFYRAVNNLVWQDDIDYIDAIMIICDEKDIDPEDLIKRKLIAPILKSRLQDECIEKGILKKEATLF
jgi:hypothetical protein